MPLQHRRALANDHCFEQPLSDATVYYSTAPPSGRVHNTPGLSHMDLV
jgi:hypothetical protein